MQDNVTAYTANFSMTMTRGTNLMQQQMVDNSQTVAPLDLMSWSGATIICGGHWKKSLCQHPTFFARTEKQYLKEELLIIHDKGSVMCLEIISYGKVCLEDGDQHFGLIYEINEVDPQGNTKDTVCIM
jgi:hypothetical protein